MLILTESEGGSAGLRTVPINLTAGRLLADFLRAGKAGRTSPCRERGAGAVGGTFRPIRAGLIRQTQSPLGIRTILARRTVGKRRAGGRPTDAVHARRAVGTRRVTHAPGSARPLLADIEQLRQTRIHARRAVRRLHTQGHADALGRLAAPAIGRTIHVLCAARPIRTRPAQTGLVDRTGAIPRAATCPRLAHEALRTVRILGALGPPDTDPGLTPLAFRAFSIREAIRPTGSTPAPPIPTVRIPFAWPCVGGRTPGKQGQEDNPEHHWARRQQENVVRFWRTFVRSHGGGQALSADGRVGGGK